MDRQSGQYGQPIRPPGSVTAQSGPQYGYPGSAYPAQPGIPGSQAFAPPPTYYGGGAAANAPPRSGPPPAFSGQPAGAAPPLTTQAFGGPPPPPGPVPTYQAGAPPSAGMNSYTPGYATTGFAQTPASAPPPPTGPPQAGPPPTGPPSNFSANPSYPGAPQNLHSSGGVPTIPMGPPPSAGFGGPPVSMSLGGAQPAVAPPPTGASLGVQGGPPVGPPLMSNGPPPPAYNQGPPSAASAAPPAGPPSSQPPPSPSFSAMSAGGKIPKQRVYPDANAGYAAAPPPPQTQNAYHAPAYQSSSAVAPPAMYAPPQMQQHSAPSYGDAKSPHYGGAPPPSGYVAGGPPHPGPPPSGLQLDNQFQSMSLNTGGRVPSGGVPTTPTGAQAAGAPASSTGAAGSRIDPSQIPRPAVQADADPSALVKFNTRSQTLPPPASSKFMAIDEGNCNPRFMRLSLNQIPHTSELLTTSSLPLAVILQPLAVLAPEEEPVPLIDCGKQGPIRCNRCRGYLNPFMNFVDQGRRFMCNLCGFGNEVPREYFCNLDANGKRRDIAERPELTHGTVEYIATPEYALREPAPPSYVFAIDVSYAAVTSQITRLTVNVIRAALDYMPTPDRTRVGIITYDKAIQFYSLKKVSGPQMLVVSDVEDVFLPLPSDFLLPLNDCREATHNLLDRIPDMFQANQVGIITSTTAAIQASFLALKACGGRIICFQSMLSTVGPGKLKQRDDTRLYGTEKEKTLLQPQDPFFQKLGTEMACAQVSLHLFMFTQNYIDVASMSVLANLTCGDVFYYPGFNVARDAEKFQEELIRCVSRPGGFEAVMRVRCSAGLCVKEHLGNFLSKNSDDLDLANIDCDKTFAVTFKHDEKLSEHADACIQAALLYTTNTGERRIRVHTLSVPVTSVLGNLFRYADLDVIMNLLARQSVAAAHQQPMEKVRATMTSSCVDILYTYRKYCTNSASSGQLILPEALKLLPLYILALTKNQAFRAGTDVRSDDRAYLMHVINQASVAFSTHYVYPRMFALHSLQPAHGLVSASGDVALPPPVSLSSEKLEADGAFLIDDGVFMYLWLGRSVPSSWLTSVFGVPPGTSVDELDTQQVQVQRLDNETSVRVNNIIHALRKNLPRATTIFPQLRIIKQREPIEAKVLSVLVEDRHQATHSYVEYLCHIHRQIQSRFT